MAEDNRGELEETVPDGTSEEACSGVRRMTRWLLLLGCAVAAAVAGAYVVVYLLPAARQAARKPPGPGDSGYGTVQLQAAGQSQTEQPEPFDSVGPPPDPDSPRPTTPAAMVEEAQHVAHWLMGQFPNDPDSLEVMARVHHWLGDSAEAIKCWEQCLELNPGYVHAYFGMGIVAEGKGDYEKAVELFRSAVELAPDSPEPQRQLASALINLGEIDEAISVLEKHVNSTPDPTAGLVMLGMAYRHRKEYERAKESYEAALRAYPANPNAYYGLAIACTRLGETEQAEQHMARFKELMGKEKNIRKSQRRQFDDLAEMSQKLADIYTTAGQLLQGNGRPAEAERLWRRAAAVDPTGVACRRALAKMLREQDRIPETFDVLEQLAAIEPENPGYQVDIGRLRAELKQFDEAEQAFRKACELAPQHPYGYVGLVQLYLKTGQKPQETVELAETAVRLQPAAMNYWLLGLARERNGDDEGALSAIRRAMGLEAGNATYRRDYQRIRDKQRGTVHGACPDSPGEIRENAPAPPGGNPACGLQQK